MPHFLVFAAICSSAITASPFGRSIARNDAESLQPTGLLSECDSVEAPAAFEEADVALRRDAPLSNAAQPRLRRGLLVPCAPSGQPSTLLVASACPSSRQGIPERPQRQTLLRSGRQCRICDAS
ncbi:hypothetical protein C8Q77DRAFT_457502 [Trametes polyzona]|nr:hypothetical protein C8Q77DRAFT_457502 [Trametes polyzona]